ARRSPAPPTTPPPASSRPTASARSWPTPPSPSRKNLSNVGGAGDFARFCGRISRIGEVVARNGRGLNAKSAAGAHVGALLGAAVEPVAGRVIEGQAVGHGHAGDLVRDVAGRRVPRAGADRVRVGRFVEGRGRQAR